MNSKTFARVSEIPILASPNIFILDIPHGPKRLPCTEIPQRETEPIALPNTPTEPFAGCLPERQQLPEGRAALAQACRYSFHYSPFWHHGTRYKARIGTKPTLLPRSEGNPAPPNDLARRLFDFSRDIPCVDPWRAPDVHFAPLKRARSPSPDSSPSSSRRRLD